MSSSCVLGFASSEWKSASGEWYDTHIGGVALWPEDLRVHVPTCPICRHHRTLVLQAYAPHSNHSEREVYLYGCNSIQCSAKSESWYAVRVVKVEVKKDVAQSSTSPRLPEEFGLCEKRQIINWDSDSDSSDSSPEALVQELEALSLAITRNDEDNKSRKCGKKAGGKALPRSSANAKCRKEGFEQQNSIPLTSFYVEVDIEPDLGRGNKYEQQVSRLLSKYNEDEKLRSESGISEQWAAEQDEEDKPEVLSVEQFNDRIARAPEQILRYDFGGKPLWPRYPQPQIKMKTCQCGTLMIFELQLLASSLHYLRPEDAVQPEQKEAAMNFASVAIYTCANDCEKTKLVAENASFKVFEQQICVQRDDW
ncbi:unnamed protein product [Agarophyton chilense]